jgi:tetratricopeptide (TPR) repeat protein
MHLSLRFRWQRALFSIVALASAAAYAWTSVRSYVAYRASTHATLDSLHRAVRLEPGNGDYHHQLGFLLLLINDSEKGAVEEYRAAVGLNPHMAVYWIDLAEAYNSSGDIQSENAAIEQAVECEPTRPAIAWEAATLYLVEGETQKAVRLMRTVLANDRDAYTARVLDTSWRATHDSELIMREILPPDPIVYSAFLQMLIAQNRAEDAAKVWQAITALGQEFDPKLAFPYFDYEIAQRNPEQAKNVWQFLQHMNPDLGRHGDSESLVYNGGFERGLLNGGFDWRYLSQPHVAVELDTSELHRGNRSLQITYDGEPSSDAGIFQLIPVQPNAKYTFSAFEKAYELLTPSGPRFHIADAYTGNTLLQTSDVLGSTVWNEVGGEFTTGPQTRLVKLTITRDPSFQRISGKLWVDDISLKQQ